MNVETKERLTFFQKWKMKRRSSARLQIKETGQVASKQARYNEVTSNVEHGVGMDRYQWGKKVMTLREENQSKKP